MDTPRFDFISELFEDEPDLEAEAQERFLTYLQLVERIATRLCQEQKAEEDNPV